jgi:hypothetical protein
MRLFAIIVVVALSNLVSIYGTDKPLTIDQDAYSADVRFLSDDDMRGRDNGTTQIGRAAVYIAERMEKAGLEPGGDRGSSFQEFPLPLFDLWPRVDEPAVSQTGRNVVGILPGADRSCTTGVVIGAHYDHVGVGRRHSMSSSRVGEIHNGADDNASGTAAVIQMARTAAANRPRFACSLVFVTFAAEEIGLIGSNHYVSQPSIPLDRTLVMINLDMIGRARGRVMIGGAVRTPALQPVVRDLQNITSLKLSDFREGYGDGASDDAPFVKAGIPALVFFTGFHDDYHRPTDDWPLIDTAGAAEVAKLALTVAERLTAASSGSAKP